MAVERRWAWPSQSHEPWGPNGRTDEPSWPSSIRRERRYSERAQGWLGMGARFTDELAGPSETRNAVSIRCI